MYLTTRSIEGDTLMACGACRHAISMNRICNMPIQSTTDILKHMAAYKASCAFVPVAPITQELEAVRGLSNKWASA